MVAQLFSLVVEHLSEIPQCSVCSDLVPQSYGAWSVTVCWVLVTPKLLVSFTEFLLADVSVLYLLDK